MAFISLEYMFRFSILILVFATIIGILSGIFNFGKKYMERYCPSYFCGPHPENGCEASLITTDKVDKEFLADLGTRCSKAGRRVGESCFCFIVKSTKKIDYSSIQTPIPNYCKKITNIALIVFYLPNGTSEIVC